MTLGGFPYVHTVEEWHLVVDTIAALGVLGGFWIAIRQLRRAAQASEDAAATARETRLLAVLQEMRDVEDRLNASAREDDHQIAERAARDWSNLASDAYALLGTRDNVDEELMSSIKNSLATATRAKAELAKRADPVTASTTKLIQAVGDICNGVGLIGSTITAQRVERTD